MISIICWLWNDNNQLHPKKRIRFTADHVNILYGMIKRNLHIDYEMVLITDNSINIDQINSEIRIIPLWDDYKEMGGCFRRLKVFSPEFKDILGNNRFVTMDIDCVITNDITPLLNRDDDFIIWAEEWRKWVYCGSMWMMNCGAREKVWAGFNPIDYPVNKNGKYSGGTDQKRINNVLYKNGENTWSSMDGVYSFITDIQKREKGQIKITHYGKRKVYGSKTGDLPKNARIVFFNGKVDPSNKELQKEYPWILQHWHE